MTTRDQHEILLSLLGEGFHTAFRKAVDSHIGVAMHHLISDMPGEDWAAVLEFVAAGTVPHLELMAESAKLPEGVPPGHPDYVWPLQVPVSWLDGDEVRYGRIAQKVVDQLPGVSTVRVRPRRASRRRGEEEVISVARTQLRRGWEGLPPVRPEQAPYKARG